MLLTQESNSVYCNRIRQNFANTCLVFLRAYACKKLKIPSDMITQETRVALGYRLGQLLRFFRALQTSCVLHNSIVHAKA